MIESYEDYLGCLQDEKRKLLSLLTRLVRSYVSAHGHALRLLDVGCGDGTLTVGLAPLVSEVRAVEADPHLADRCRFRALSQGTANVQVLAADWFHSPLPGGNNLLLFSHSLYHLGSWELFLPRVQEVSDTGALVIVALRSARSIAGELLSSFWPAVWGSEVPETYFIERFAAFLRRTGVHHKLQYVQAQVEIPKTALDTFAGFVFSRPDSELLTPILPDIRRFLTQQARRRHGVLVLPTETGVVSFEVPHVVTRRGERSTS